MKEDDTGNLLACAYSRESSGIGCGDDPEGGVERPEIVSN